VTLVGLVDNLHQTCSWYYLRDVDVKTDDYRYVLLKERNVIMTMEEEYRRQGELFPNPERLEKVQYTSCVCYVPKSFLFD